MPAAARRRRVPRLGAILALAGAGAIGGAGAGCASYTERVRDVLDAAEAGDPQRAYEAATTHLEEAGDDGGDRPLLLLERSTINMMLGRHADAERDLREADGLFEILDFSRDPTGAAARWLVREEAGIYRGGPHEKLLIGVNRLAAALASGDRELAGVAARRSLEQAEYWVRFLSERKWESPLLWFLAGVALEAQGDDDNARVLYDRARAAAPGDDLFAANYARLARATGMRDDLLTRGLAKTPVPDVAGKARLLILLYNGRAPVRTPVRKIIDPAVLSALGADVALAGNVVMFGGFETRGARFHDCRLTLSDDPAVEPPRGPSRGADVEAQVTAWWKEQEPFVYMAAVSRWVTRYVAGAAVGQVVKKESDSKVLGDLARLFTSAALSSADIPDTRSWNLLPREILLFECWLPPGEVTGALALGGGGGGGGRQVPFRATLVADRPTLLPLFAWE
ncbi:MAG: hypothetical protein HY719_01400 [Planctomycetes bacterium]|nr:hypothetical protein [Planctomycetota bacterium]